MIPELLAPAGGMNQLIAAVRFGADAVYLGLDQFGMRAHAANFTPEELKKAVAYCHDHGVRAYLTLNIFAFDEDISPMTEAAIFAQSAGVDAFIMSDIGAIMAVKAALPQVEIHLSTQMSSMNTPALRFYHDAGIKRVVLARELSLSQIKAMGESLPADCELEAFVHGAVCMAYSGRCALSHYMTGRSANRGDCAQACRWSYHVVEEKRPGEYFPVTEDEGGTRIFSAGDMNMIRHLPALCDAGLSALKIEGRMKNEYYVATVTGAYRRGLDAVQGGSFTPDLADQLAEELECVSHRPYDTGFYFGSPAHPGGQAQLSQSRELVARVLSWDCGQASVQLKRQLTVGEALELVTPRGITPFTLTGITLADGAAARKCAVPDSVITIPLNAPCEAGDLIRGKNVNHA